MYIPKYDNYKQERHIGEYTIYLPDPPNLTKITGYGKAQQKQKYDYFDLPKGWEQWPQKDKQEIIDAAWKRRIDGHFFMNNGNIEYITGANDFFLSFWRLPPKKDLGFYGKPFFIDAQQDIFLLWKFAVEDDRNCGGLCLIGDRRSAKTAISTCLLFEATSRTEGVQSGIQSKNNTDAKKVFDKIIYSWRRLPEFFLPTDAGESRPTTKLEFFEARKTSRKKVDRTQKETLDSFIDYENAKAVAYDGIELFRCIQDEFGKTTEENVHERALVVRECMKAGSSIVGKMFWTTTVEEMEKKGGANAKLVWDDCDPKLADQYGRTPLYMKRLFKSADYGLMEIEDDPENSKGFVDEFGYSNREKAKEYILNSRKNKKGATLASERRKLPLDLKDVFQTLGSDNQFPSDRIHAQKEYLELNPQLTRRIDFYRDASGVVKWRDNPENGKFKMVWDFPNPSQSNNCTITASQTIPHNTHQFIAAADPFKMSDINKANGQGSKCVGYVKRKLNPLDPENTNILVCQYSYRQPRKNMMWDDLIMMCEYYGCKINIEDDVNDFVDYFPMVGKQGLLITRPKSTIDPNRKNGVAQALQKFGTPSADPYVIESHYAIQINYAADNVERVFFEELLDDWLDFDVNDRTKFDHAMACGYVLLADFEYTRPMEPPQPRKVPLVKTFNLTQGR